jgi:hypothetical protein
MSEAHTFKVGPRFYACYAAAVLLLFPLHSVVHFIAYRTLGVPALMTYFSVKPTNGFEREPIAELAAPILNLTIAIAATLAYRSSVRHRMVWAALAVSAALTRLMTYVLIAAAAALTGSGMDLVADESSAAHLWGLPSLLFVAALAVPFGAVTWSVARTFAGSTIKRAGHVVALAMLTQLLTIVAGNVLDPWLFPPVRGLVIRARE